MYGKSRRRRSRRNRRGVVHFMRGLFIETLGVAAMIGLFFVMQAKSGPLAERQPPAQAAPVQTTPSRSPVGDQRRWDRFPQDRHSAAFSNTWTGSLVFVQTR